MNTLDTNDNLSKEIEDIKKNQMEFTTEKYSKKSTAIPL